jgi:glycosyltransferase involved in cell wall biosynthesis
MKASVVTVCLNSEAYIGECMDSVKNQRYTELEHVIVDGQSTDRTLEIIDAHKRGYNVKLISEKDSGTHEAIKKALGASSGDIVGWLMSDDLLLPGAVTNVVDKFSKRPDAGVVYGDGLIQPYGQKWATVYFTPPEELIIRHLRYNCFFDVGSFLRRSVLDSVGPYGDLKFAGDYEFYLRASRQFKFAKVDALLGCWRYRPESLSFKSGEERKRVKRENPDITSRIASLEGIEYYSRRILSVMKRQAQLVGSSKVSTGRLLAGIMLSPLNERGQSSCGYLYRE